MIWLVIAVLLAIVSPALATDRYVIVDGLGSGTCTTLGTACHMVRATAVAVCGDTIRVQDGTYRGVNNMFDSFNSPVANPTCTSGAQMTVRAENDGGVFLDGEFARTGLAIANLTYWNFSGFDAGNGSDNGTLYGAPAYLYQSDHITVQRVCASNVFRRSPAENVHTFPQITTTNSLLEDICVFGTGRNSFVEGTSPGTGNVYRRWWVRWEGVCPNSSNQTGGIPLQPSYYSSTGDLGTGGNNLWENFIVIYDPEQYDQSPACGSWTDDGPIPGLFQRGASLTNTFKGFIMYGYDGFTTANRTATTLAWLNDTWAGGTLAFTRVYADIFIDRRSQNNASTGRTFSMSCTAGASCNGNTATRLTAIRNSANPASVVSGWTSTNFNECTSLSGCPNIYTGDSPGTGSRACFEYSNGTLTSTKLWPWRMDDRIKAALARANAAGTGGSALAGTAGSGYAANTVTSEIVNRYGSIPTACLTSSSFTPSFPVASDFPSVTVRDDFNRTASTLGTSWTELLADTFSAANAAVAPSTGGGFARALYNDTKMQTSHEVYATWTTLAEPGGYATFLSFAGTDLTANNQYRVVVNQTSGSNTLLKVQRIDGVGTATDILSAVDLGIEAVDGNSFGVRVSGTTISVYWKWTDDVWYRVGEFTDSNLSTLPSTGVYGGIAGGSPSVIDNYGAGPFVDQPVQEPPAPAASVGAGRFGTTFPGVR